MNAMMMRILVCSAVYWLLIKQLNTSLDIVQGAGDDLGEPMWRDPDALPPSNWFERIMSMLYHGTRALGGGNFLYAVKAGILTSMYCLVKIIRQF
jgi:hypothetical protein